MERKLGTPLGADYRAAREEVRSRPQDIPSVTIYRPNEHEQLDAALHTFTQTYGLPPFEAHDGKVLHAEAVRRKILLDTFDLQLVDSAKARREKDHFDTNPRVLQRYIDKFDRLEYKLVAKYSWIDGKGSFATVLDADTQHATTHSRNKLIVPDDVQQVLRKKRVGDAGMGVGTSLGNAQYKAGIENFVVADGGDINLHDFNRLPGASVRKIGQNHAIHWTQMAWEANPHLNIRCIPQNLGDGTNGTFPIHDFLDGVDIVFEEVDNLSAKIAIRKAARERRIPVIMATDVKMGTIIDFQPGEPDAEIFPNLSQKHVRMLEEGVPVDFRTATDMAIEIVGEEAEIWRQGVDQGLGFWSQTGAAAAASEVGIVKTLVKWAQGEEVPLRQVYLLDAA